MPYASALREIGFGKKRSHWIWYVIPAHKNIRPQTSRPKYCLPSMEAHRAYLGHEVLRKRLIEILSVTLTHLTSNKRKNLKSIYGITDAEKVRETCSMFAIASRMEIENPTWCNKEFAKNCLNICIAVLLSDTKKDVTTLHPKAIRVYREEISASSKRFETTLNILRIGEKVRNKEEDDVITTSCKEDNEEEEKPERKFEWQDGKKWVPFSDEISKKIDQSLNRGDRIVKYQIKGTPYVLNAAILSKMKQRNRVSGFERSVRVSLRPEKKKEEEEEEEEEEKYEWTWFDGDHWIAYNKNIALKLESALRNRENHLVSFVTNGGQKYVVNLKTMKQRNLRTNFYRRVRRNVENGSTATSKNTTTVTSLPTLSPSPPPPPQTCSYSNIVSTDSKTTRTTRCMFKSKRSSGPLKSYCQICSLHISKHDEEVGGIFYCPKLSRF